MDTLHSQRHGNASRPDGQLQGMPSSCLAEQERDSLVLITTRFFVILPGDLGAKGAGGIKSIHATKPVK